MKRSSSRKVYEQDTRASAQLNIQLKSSSRRIYTSRTIKARLGPSEACTSA